MGGRPSITNTPLLPQKRREKHIPLSFHPSLHACLLRCLVVPSVSIWMYEFVTAGSSTMDWLCRFVKDKGSAGIIDFGLFNVRAQAGSEKRKLIKPPLYARACFSLLVDPRESYLGGGIPRCFAKTLKLSFTFWLKGILNKCMR